jgi:hypothetical protein
LVCIGSDFRSCDVNGHRTNGSDNEWNKQLKGFSDSLHGSMVRPHWGLPQGAEQHSVAEIKVDSPSHISMFK